MLITAFITAHLSQINPLHTFLYYLPKFSFKIIFQSTQFFIVALSSGCATRTVLHNVPSSFFYRCADLLMLRPETFTRPDACAALQNFFLICIIRIFITKMEKFQLRGNNSVCAGASKSTAVPRTHAAYREHRSSPQSEQHVPFILSFCIWRS
jgi:hypothetical protein